MNVFESHKELRDIISEKREQDRRVYDSAKAILTAVENGVDMLFTEKKPLGLFIEHKRKWGIFPYSNFVKKPMHFKKTGNEDSILIMLRYNKAIYVGIMDKPRVICGEIDFDYTLKKEKPDFEIVEESLTCYFSSDEILKFILEILVQVQED